MIDTLLMIYGVAGFILTFIVIPVWVIYQEIKDGW